MSTNTPEFNLSAPFNSRVAIIVARWNGHITERLLEGAVSHLHHAGLKDEDIDIYHVPGAVELTFAASQVIESSSADAVICFGCVIRGDTPHFDYVCQSVTQGITHLNATCDVPVIFGLLTVENEQQALDRIGGPHGHKGEEAADTAVEMMNFVDSMIDEGKL